MSRNRNNTTRAPDGSTPTLEPIEEESDDDPTSADLDSNVDEESAEEESADVSGGVSRDVSAEESADEENDHSSSSVETPNDDFLMSNEDGTNSPPPPQAPILPAQVSAGESGEKLNVLELADAGRKPLSDICPNFTTLHDFEQREVLRQILQTTAAAYGRELFKDPRDGRVNEDMFLKVFQDPSGGHARSTYVKILQPCSKDFNNKTYARWADQLPAHVIKEVLENPDAPVALDYFCKAVWSTTRSSSKSFQVEQMAQEFVLVNSEIDVVKYDSTCSRVAQLLHVNRDLVDEIRTYFFDADQIRCYYTPCQFALILDCVSTDPTDTFRNKLDKPAVLARVAKMNSKQAEFDAAGAEVLGTRKRVDFPALSTALDTGLTAVQTDFEATLVQKWSTSGRVTRFINTPAGGGKTYIAAEIVHVLLGVTSMMHTLARLSTWTSNILNNASHGMIVKDTDDRMETETMCMSRMCIVAVDSALIDTWKRALSREDCRNRRVVTVKDSVSLTEMQIQCGESMVNDMSTQRQVEFSNSLITLCDKRMLHDVLVALRGKPFVSLVIDDPLPVVGKSLDPICQRVFLLSANSTEFVSELATLNRPHIYANMLAQELHFAEKKPFQIRDALCLPPTGTLGKDAIAEQVDRMRGNVIKQATCVMNSFFFDWMLEEMAVWTPKSVVKFPLMDTYETKIGRSFFSPAKQYQPFTADFITDEIILKRSDVFLSDGVTIMRPDLFKEMTTAGILSTKPSRGRKKSDQSEEATGQQPAESSAKKLKNGEKAIAQAEEGSDKAKDFVLGINFGRLFAGCLEACALPAPAAGRKRGRNAQKGSQQLKFFALTNSGSMLHSVIPLSEARSNLDSLPTDTSGELATRISNIKDTLTRRHEQKCTLLCTNCGHGFDESDFCVSLYRARYQCMVCPGCAEASAFSFTDLSVVNFDKISFKAQLNSILDTQLPGSVLSDVLNSCTSSWKSATAGEQFELASFSSLFLLIGALIRNSPIVKRILLYVADETRASVRLMTTLLSEILSLEVREYSDQPVKNAFLASLLDKQDVLTLGQSKKRKATKHILDAIYTDRAECLCILNRICYI
eukprot:gene253-455_t